MLRRSLSIAAFLVAGSVATHSQTTHEVTLSGTTFSPSSLTIAVGDTVEWTWLGGVHNVRSGVGGVGNGIFDSGAPVSPPQSFSVTFDQAFLDANPVPGKVYDYFCSVHVSFGMTGTVTVGVPATAVPRNAGNPASLTAISPPIIGANFTLTVDLTTTGHSTALLFGFDSPVSITLGGGQVLLCFDLGGNGELLGASPQPGPNALFLLPVPNDTSLCGLSLTTQAIHFGGVAPFALSSAVDVVVGNL